MAEILTRPKIKYEFTEDGYKMYSLKKPLMFNYKNKLHIINPQDENGVFLFNLASVPWYLKWLHKPNSKQTLYSSIAHDYRYGNRNTSRLEDDLIFLSLTKYEQSLYAKTLGTKIRYFISRWGMFILLRLFGWREKA